MQHKEKAYKPEEIAELFVKRINSGDVDGIVALYETDAVLATGSGVRKAVGNEEIGDYYTELLSDKPRFEKGVQRPAMVNGDLALTSSRLVNGTVTAEVARRQPDGSWLWLIDQPVIASETNK